MRMVELRVKEASQQHVGKGVAVLHPETALEHGWQAGQILELAYGKRTHVKAWPGSTGEIGAGDVRIDGAARQNIGAGIGDKIRVRAAGAAPADEITLSPTEDVLVEGLEGYMSRSYQNHVFTTGDSLAVGARMGGQVRFVVAGTRPAGAVIVTEGTAFRMGPAAKVPDAGAPRVTYDELGGLGDAVKKIREMVELPMRHPELFERIGVEAPKGVLLHGPPGTGKTLIAKALAGETSAHFISISGPEIVGRHYGESEERVREVFEQAGKNTPSIIFIDEIDSIAPRREEVTGEVEKRIVSQLLTLMDGMKGRGRVVVVAATNRPDSIDPALRRPGRFDREIEVGIPDEAGRLEILNIHTRGMPLDEGDLAGVARITHGFVGADLAALAKEAAMRSLRRVLPDVDLDQDRIPGDVLQRIRVGPDDFRDALREVKPSALREVLVQVPDVSLDDVGGLDAVKKDLREAVEWPLRHGEICGRMGVRPPKGILIHGPPGTGKTLIAKALAKTTESNFISVKGPELLSKWVGESEKGVREVFRKARQGAPCIRFFDEIDALVPRRGGGDSSRVSENVVSQILTEIDGLEELHGVLVIGATNRLDILDEAVLRPGRFDYVVEAPKPDEDAREEILRIHAGKRPLGGDVDIRKVARLTGGMSGAEIASVVDGAARDVVRRYIADAGRGAAPDGGSYRIGQGDLEAAVARHAAAS